MKFGFEGDRREETTYTLSPSDGRVGDPTSYCSPKLLGVNTLQMKIAVCCYRKLCEACGFNFAVYFTFTSCDSIF
jgi:hypothetical protein